MKRAEQKKSWDGCGSRYTHCRFWVWGWVRPGVDCSGKWVEPMKQTRLWPLSAVREALKIYKNTQFQPKWV